MLCAMQPAGAQTSVHFPDRSYSTLSYGGSLWIGTPRGLYRYRYEDNVWSAYGPQNGLLSPVITSLDMQGDMLWIGQDRGVTAFDLRSNTMLHFDSSKGLHTGGTRGVSFEEEYVWTGGSAGAARYDNLIEEWQRIGAAEGLSGDTVHAIVPDGARVFIATERGVNEYDTRHERWRVYGSPNERPVLDAFTSGGWLWLLREDALLRFDTDARVYALYPLREFRGSGVREIIISGGGFWLVTKDNLWQYDATADALRPFLEIEQLPDRDLHAMAMSSNASTFWFSTASGLTRYIHGSSSWFTFTAANGVPDADFRNLFPLGDGVVTFSDEKLVYYLADEDRWYTFPLLAPEAGDGARVSLDPAAGSYADFGGGVRLDLSGSRSAWLWQDPFGQDEFIWNGEDPSKRNDLKARLDLGGGRRISASYHDADYEDVVYGAEYRGARDDVLQSLQWGDMRLEQGTSVLQQSLGIFGVGGRAVYGERTPRYGRSLIEVSAMSGHKTTARTTDVFQGQRRERSASVNDAGWLRNTYYSLRPDRRLLPLDADEVTLYRPLYEGAPAGLSDLRSTTIAGITADWRPLDDGINYVLDREQSVIILQGEDRYRTMAARMVKNGIVTELLLGDESGQYQELRNRYDVGYGLIPSSLRIRIMDINGNETPLSLYGLDGDGDGRVDAEFMDFSSGILRFPADQPFPEGAYGDPGTVTYRMQVEYESMSTSYSLSRRHIVRGSETVLVDGLPVTAGEDYILDYSGGYLVFTRDGAVLDDSRVEISYEYVRNKADERVTQAAVTVSPSDFMQASVSAGRFHAQDASAPTTFMQGGGELRWQSDALDLRVQPEYRHTVSDSASGDAAGLSAALSTAAARLSLRSTLRSDGYRELLASDFAGNRLRADHALKAEYDVSTELRLFATHRQRSGTDTLTGDESRDLSSTVGLQLIRADWPSVTLQGDYLEVGDRIGTRDRRGGRVDATWNPAATLLDMAGIQAARLSGYARISEERVQSGSYPGTYRTQNYFLRTVVNPRPLFTINTWYQGDAREQRGARDEYLPDYQRDKYYLDILAEHLRGLSLGGRITSDVRQMMSSARTQDRQHSSTLQGNVRMAPGAWIDILQPFTIYGSVQHSERVYRSMGTDAAGFVAAFFSRGNGRVLSRNWSTWYETRLEWRPVPELLYSATGILRDFSYESMNSSSESGFWQLIQRADYRPDSRALYGMQFSMRQDDGGNSPFNPHGYRYAPSAWAERRLSRALLLRLMVDGEWYNTPSDVADYSGHGIAPSGNLTLSLEDMPILRRAELRVDVRYAYGYSRSDFHFAEDTEWTTETLSSNFYVDLYPHPVLFVRFRYFLTWNNPSSWLNYRILGIDGWQRPDAELQVVMQL